MKDLFCGYYRPTEDEFRMLWSKGIFILDTSFILNLYRYSKETRDDMLKILRKLSERLWIPYQVALEYQENYPRVIEEQKSEYNKVKGILKDPKSNIRNEQILNRLLEDLDYLEQSQPDYNAMRSDIEQIFDKKVGPPPDSQQWLDEVCKEGEDRYRRELPPGYVDPKKKGEKVCAYGGFSFKEKYGDLILWKQLIKQATEREDFKYIVFITDDSTEDWWWLDKSKTIGPRPELVREIMAEANVSFFYMYKSERFMKYAQEYLNIPINQESINQVRDMSKAFEEYQLRVTNMSDQAVDTPWGNIIAGGTLDVIPPVGFRRPGAYTIIFTPPEPSEDEIEKTKEAFRETRRKTLTKGEFKKEIE